MTGVKRGLSLGLLLLSACATRDPGQDQPARLSAPGGKNLQQAVETALGVPVMLADNTLVNSSQLVIERKQRRQLDQGLLMGTDLSGPLEQFTLVRNGKQCVLIKHSDNSRWPVGNVRCVAE